MKRPAKGRILDEQRKAQVIVGLGGFQGTPLERTLAFWSEYTWPEKDVIAIVRLAYSRAGRDFLRDLAEHAAQHPTQKDLADAIRAVRRVWRHVLVDPPPADRNRHVEWNRHQMAMLWLVFTTAWSKACEKRPKAPKGPVREALAQAANPNRRQRNNEAKRPRWMKLTSARQIKNVVEKFERETPKSTLHQMYRNYFPKTYQLMGIPDAPT